MSTQQRNRFALLISVILVAVSFVRFPVAEGLLRPEYQLLAESGIIILFAVFIFVFLNKWIGLFLALSVFSAVFPVFGKWSYMARGTIVLGCLWYAIIVMTVDDSSDILTGLCIIAIGNTLFSVMQYFGYDPFNIFSFGLMKSTSSQITGFMANKNTVSAVLAFCFPAFLRPKWVFLIWIPLIGLYLSSSSGGTLAAGAGFIFYVLYRFDYGIRRVIYVSLAFVYLAVFALYFDVLRIPQARIDGWVEGYLLLKQNWLIGSGIGHSKILMHYLSQVPGFAQLHNDIFQLVCEMGVVVIPVIVGYMSWLYRKMTIDKLIPATAIVVICTNALVNFPFHIGTTAIIAATWFGLFDIKVRAYE